ncbi:SGNH/GDSL hydrolase family protein [Actinomadura meridiana]|uniref:SGNH/GDSL hydrolase family protein n=1 Tax=Actinomadura meridiana TaxID=559626 RepID=A0ABP8C874_9ACTN
MNTTELIQKYLDVWNERDAAVREALMKEVLTEDSVYSDPDYAGLHGHAALSDAIHNAHEKLGDLRFTLDTVIGVHHDRALFRWRLGTAATGYDVVEFSGERVQKRPGLLRMSGWSAAWTTSPQRPGASFAPNWSEEGFRDQSVRQTVRLSVGGDSLRVRLTNRYGTVPLQVAGASVAATAGRAAVRSGTVQELAVDGKPSFAVPPGADLATDPVEFATSAQDAVTITMYLAEPSGPATYHAQALATTFRARGDQLVHSGSEPFTETSQSWYYLSGVDVTGASGDGIMVLGDSLVDGTGGTPDTDHRFPDLLARRLIAARRPRAVLNQGIGGNRVTVDSPSLGDRATVRFDLDVLSQPGVSTVIVLAGINDIAISEIADESPFPVLAPYTEVSADEVIAGHRDMIARARAADLRTVGTTLPPMRGSAFSTARSEAERTTLNTWIRESGEYDAVIDLARAMGDVLAPAHDSGDHLHPSDAGYQAMADAVDLTVL